MNTYTTRTGRTILAGDDGRPITHANRSQAERRAEKLRAEGFTASAFQSAVSRRFHVSVDRA